MRALRDFIRRSRARRLGAIAVVGLGFVVIARTRPSVPAAITSVAGSDAESAAGRSSDEGPVPLAVPARRARSAERDADATGRSAEDGGGGPDETAASRPPVELPTHVEIVDAITGVEIRCESWEPVASGDEEKPSGRRSSRVGDPIAVPAPTAVAIDDFAPRPPGTSPLVRPAAGERRLRAPAPYFAWTAAKTATLSDRARGFRVVRPLHRELDVRVRLVEADGSPSDARVASWTVAGEDDADARVEVETSFARLRDVPWLPGEPLRFALWGVPPEERDAAPQDLLVQIPEIYGEGIVGSFVVTWGDARIGPDRNLILACGGRGWARGPRALRNARTATVRARFLEPDGRPLAGVRVHVADRAAITDADGVAWAKSVRAGEALVSVKDSGWRIQDRKIRVEPDGETTVELREERAGLVEVIVVDEESRPRPSATVELEPKAFPWFDVDALGVQRLDPFTDALGRRLCRSVPIGRAKVRARWAGREGTAEIEVLADATSVARVVVR